LFTATLEHHTVQRLGNGLNEPEILVRFPGVTTNFSQMTSVQPGSRMALKLPRNTHRGAIPTEEDRQVLEVNHHVHLRYRIQGPGPPIHITLHKMIRHKTSSDIVRLGQEELHATLHPENISPLPCTEGERTQPHMIWVRQRPIVSCTLR
jgi:hypothetical protein